MRKSLKQTRDETLFRFFEEEMKTLKQQAFKEDINLYYFDGTGFNLNPNVPYCWTEKGKTTELPALRSRGYTVLGLLDKDKSGRPKRFSRSGQVERMEKKGNVFAIYSCLLSRTQLN